MRILLFCFFVLILNCSFAQEQTNTNVGQLTLMYFPIERVKASGNTDLYLPTHSDFLKPFDSSTRFAPDEPSTFSSLEYTFLSRSFNTDLRWDWSVGIFRNHTKGDFLLSQDTVHFGLGNSQVGISSTGKLYYQLPQEIAIGLFLQLGIGPHFSQWTGFEKEMTPVDWGIAGWGLTNNVALFLESPYFFKRWKINVLAIYNWSYSTYEDIEVFDSRENETTFYENIHFATRSKRPNFTITLSYNLKVNK